jgi:hypothetical protein
MKDYKTVIVSRIKETKEKANDEAKTMMRNLMDQNKLTGYLDCIDDRLLDFKDKPYIKDTCLRYFGESGYSACIEKKDFCSQCCSFHVGIRYTSKLFDCKSKCTKLISGLELDEKDRKGEFKDKNDKGERFKNNKKSTVTGDENSLKKN